MGYSTWQEGFVQAAVADGCPAKTLGPQQRLALSVQALAGEQSITALAEEHQVSRKFVYQQAATAQSALADAFDRSTAADERVLFELPVTRSWLRQVVLGLTLIGHSSYRGVSEFCRDLLDVSVSVGTVHNIVRDAVETARVHNRGQDLAAVDMAGLDEIFQNGRPVLVVADIASSYCCLLSPEEHRDADTWGVRLLELQDRGWAPRATIADFGTGLRAGQKLALPEVPCRGDVFHVLQEITRLLTSLENRAYDALSTQQRCERQQARARRRGQRTHRLTRRSTAARQAATRAVDLADEVVVLAGWLRRDIFAVSGLSYADRGTLLDFVRGELQNRSASCARLKPLCVVLKNHRDELLAFAAQLDHDRQHLAESFEVAPALVAALLDLEASDPRQPQRWQQEAVLRRQLGQRFHLLRAAVQDLAAHTVRASSVVENLNSRLRTYFFLRRHLGPDYLTLLQFFLNHRRFLRSRHAERVDHSPTELLTGQAHPHWLAMLGYTPFSRN